MLSGFLRRRRKSFLHSVPKLEPSPRYVPTKQKKKGGGIGVVKRAIRTPLKQTERCWHCTGNTRECVSHAQNNALPLRRMVSTLKALPQYFLHGERCVWFLFFFILCDRSLSCVTQEVISASCKKDWSHFRITITKQTKKNNSDCFLHIALPVH